ncbi:hypothetical protein EYB45_10150 [Erythrobacteraceae bacterium CFH 75059]|uniref:hypothetical protein n=1 Tax=Qipengyuania thermophila TaxID=2509361 RepID=UPI00101FE9C4|nr:hypothetical protein [Qipengyuania thermophila]TCD02037.1 hypothetical protein EYB45_10150 [Erythrobacteraceae bacterium CFH 75059]
MTVSDDGIASTTITVVNYNVAGLPFPVRRGTGTAMARIADAMTASWNGDGRPDLLLLQEAFVPSASRLTFAAGFANHVRGPSAASRPSVVKPNRESAEVLSRRIWRRGEGWPRMTGAGLALGTDFGIAAQVNEPFGPRSCAGWDCLSNKGVALTWVEIPGVPEPLLILNTHLNSRGSTGVSRERADLAHRQQVREMGDILARHWQGEVPLVYAGDFNTRNVPFRFDLKDERLPGELAHRFCFNHPERCRITMSWDSDEPWMDTQDLQGYASSRRIRVEPVAIAAEFDAPVDGEMLSDHDALRVTYRLSWRVDGQPWSDGLQADAGAGAAEQALGAEPAP